MHWLLHIDLVARNWVVLHRVGVLDGPLYVLTVVGRFGLVWLGIAALLALVRRITWGDAAKVLLAIVVALVVTDYALKPVVGRQRPFLKPSAAADVIGGRPKDASFPSGHASSAFAGATTLTRVVPEAAVLWWVLAIAIAYSRVYLGVHYPLDVMAGAAIGTAVAWLVLRLTRAYRLGGR